VAEEIVGENLQVHCGSPPSVRMFLYSLGVVD
jgi:hypothetical protein